MSSHAQDSSTQKQASSGSQAQDQQLAQNAAKNQQFADNTRSSLFGNYGTGGYTGGSLSSYLNPSTMNDNGQLKGSYLAQYNAGANTNAQGAKNAVGTTMTNLAQRGMGKSPAGFAADQERKAYEDQANSNAGLYSGLATGQHNENVNNFWQANNMLNSNASQTANLSVQGNQAAAGNYASLYGTASQQTPSAWGTALGAAAGVGAGWASGGFKMPGH